MLRAAAWSVPAVSIASAAPAFAASTGRAVEVVRAPTLFAANWPYTGMEVAVTQDGTRLAGEDVTVHLSAGLAFEDGSTTWQGVTGGAPGVGGHVEVPAFYHDLRGVTSPLVTILHGTATKTVVPPPVEVWSHTLSRSRVTVNEYTVDTVTSDWWDVPIGSRPVGGRAALTPGGDLVVLPPDATSVSTLASGVTSAWGEVRNGTGRFTWYDGAVRTATEGGTALTLLASAPAGTSIVGHEASLTPTGTAYRGTAPLGSNVSSAVARHTASSNSTAHTFVSDRGWLVTGGRIQYWMGVSTYRAAGHNIFFEPSHGQLLLGNPDNTYTTVLARDGRSVVGITSYDIAQKRTGGLLITYVTPTGAYVHDVAADTTDTLRLPADTRVVGPYSFLTPGGNLYVNEHWVAGAVVDAVARFDTDDVLDVTVIGAR